jgi:hypothetical protein
LLNALAFERRRLMLLLRESRLAPGALEIVDAARLASGTLMGLGRAPMRLHGVLMRRDPASRVIGMPHPDIILALGPAQARALLRHASVGLR